MWRPGTLTWTMSFLSQASQRKLTADVPPHLNVLYAAANYRNQVATSPANAAKIAKTTKETSG
ncbi:exported hypothetical protein [Mesorhizobium metallidurans STM 2683]|uniref:Uncharacterized protein n=1 Tax=Mesorhizobium metallidurans STM 2683 TaxID=1297569 RepID=M5F1M7_9HYPH|nr:exported hypothetical protein [Mesorhizobium metallidurans STM 2683]